MLDKSRSSRWFLFGSLLVGALNIAPLASAQPPSSGELGAGGRNLIFITWDGVRREEFLGKVSEIQGHQSDEETLPFFWHQLAATGRIYGDPRQDNTMIIANPAFISLPAYQSIFSGRPSFCQNNVCDQVENTTFPERLVHELGFRKDEVASFSSWEYLPFAVESQPGTIYVNAGISPTHLYHDEEEVELNRAQASNPPPWPDSRGDSYTWRHAMRYLETKRPRFLYIALDDSDAWGHQVEYTHYLEALQHYDQWLKGLVTKLASMGDYGKQTCLVITTDHGRGSGAKWYTHSNGALHSGYVLMYAGCPFESGEKTFKEPPTLTTHLDIKPTIEDFFGLEPEACTLCGVSLLTPLSEHTTQVKEPFAAAH